MMKKQLVHPLTIVVMVAVGFLGCSSKFSGFDKSSTGLYYKIVVHGDDTAKAKTGDFVSLDMKYTTEKDSLLFDSKTGMQGQSIRFQLPPSDFDGDLYEGIRMLAPGDSGIFMINADSLFTKTFKMPQRPEFVDSNSYLKFYIKLVSADAVEELAAKEVGIREQYLRENNIATEPLPSGLYYIETSVGDGKTIDSGDVVELHFVITLADGTPVFSSYERGQTITMNYGKPFDTPGFDEGVGYMRAGGKSKFIVPSEIAFGAGGRGGQIPPFSTMVYDVEVISVMAKADFEKKQEQDKKQQEMMKDQAKGQEGTNLQKYLQEKKINVKPTASGLYYIEQSKGTGAKAEAGKKVTVHYTGTLLNGTKFDSSRDRDNPFTFTLGQGQVIQGWDEGIALMNVGGKATLIIPSGIGYRDRDMGVIPPYSTLLFDVELLNVE